MPFEFGDVVLVPFPFTNQVASKQRPAVVVSSDAYNAAKPIEQNLVIRRLGVLDAQDQAALRAAVTTVLG